MCIEGLTRFTKTPLALDGECFVLGGFQTVHIERHHGKSCGVFACRVFIHALCFIPSDIKLSDRHCPDSDVLKSGALVCFCKTHPLIIIVFSRLVFFFSAVLCLSTYRLSNCKANSAVSGSATCYLRDCYLSCQQAKMINVNRTTRLLRTFPNRRPQCTYLVHL